MQSKGIKNCNLLYNRSQKNSSVFLDTLEVTSEIFRNKTHENLYHSTIRKHSTITKLKLIIDTLNEKKISVEIQKKYWKTYHCNKVFLTTSESIKGSLCRKRWCAHCNRIKTAEMLNAYTQPFKELEKENALYFITLTAPTVKERQLRSEIKKRYNTFVMIKDKLRKKGIKLTGLRKIEVTYNEIEDKYHPHFHFIQQGYVEATELLNEWLNYWNRCPTNERAKRIAQDITPIEAESKSLIEIMKYATKDIIKNNTSAYAYHNIQTALVGIRVFQTYGKLKKVKAPKEAKEDTYKNEITSENDIFVYDHLQIDYLNARNEKLINTLDIKKQIEIYEQIKSN